MSKYVLSDIFSGNFPVTQVYGNNPTYYSQFGFNGHEGTDWGTPNGTPVLAPFDGIVLRDTDSAKEDNYGIKVVLWDPVQKCAAWFCHLQSNSVNLGEKVKKGQIIGLSNNTGNTSGPHLHVNFCETDVNGNRLNTDNGYKGFLDILNPNLVEWKLTTATVPPTPPNAPQEVTIDLTGLVTELTKTVNETYGVLNKQQIEAKFTAKDLMIHNQLQTIGDQGKEIALLKVNPQVVYKSETFLEFLKRVLGLA